MTFVNWDCKDYCLGPGGHRSFPGGLPSRLGRRHPHLTQALLPCSTTMQPLATDGGALHPACPVQYTGWQALHAVVSSG